MPDMKHIICCDGHYLTSKVQCGPISLHCQWCLLSLAKHNIGCITDRAHLPLQDLMTNPLIVPVKILRGHEMNQFEGVFDCAFHPTQPWIFTAGADGSICLFTN